MEEKWYYILVTILVISGVVALILKNKNETITLRTGIAEVTYAFVAGGIVYLMVNPLDFRQAATLGLITGFNAEYINQMFKSNSLKSLNEQKSLSLEEN
ncbi:hypothetical protein [Psychrobacillus sp. FSL K6-1267]|uniref:hypothetical protein n=1 Tax=Psychrobacillus sp. FSL K6-1267 TaxID=2921543 RepID=UPI0030FA3BFB